MLIDAHTHLDRYESDIASVLGEMRRRRVFTVAVAMDPDSHARTVALVGDEPLVLPALGVHPARAMAWAGRIDEVVAGMDTAAMVGEIGLDHHWVADASGYATQALVFAALLGAAVERDLVVNLHTKAAEDLVVEHLERADVRRAIVHWYAGPVRAFRALVERGTYFSVGVGILKDDVARAIAAEIPADRLLTETDNPRGWQWLDGEEGRPSLLIDVQRELARVRGLPVKDLQEQVRANFERLMDGDERLVRPYEQARASFG